MGMFILALIPIIFLIIALMGLKWPGHVACPVALVITLIEALFIWQETLPEVLLGAVEGFAMAIWPICLVIIAAIFTYNLVVHTKKMEIIKRILTSVSMDKRILVLIIAWGFGGFMEGMAGFGTAVAIPAGILCGLGFNPIFAAVVCLVANTTPVAFGSVGIPTVTAANVAGTDPNITAAMTVLQLAIMVIIVPFLVVHLTGKYCGGKGKEIFSGLGMITLMSGISFLIPQFLAGLFIGAELPSVIGSVCSMGVTILMTRLLRKDKTSSFDMEMPETTTQGKLTIKDGVVAWSPFILVLILLLLTSSLVPAIYAPLAAIKTSVLIYPGEGGAPYTFSWIAPGVIIFIAAFIGGLIQRCPIGEMGGVLVATIKQMSKTIITIMAVLAIAKVMGYSGMTGDIAAFIIAVTGGFYPLLAPLIGSIGTFVTGSATSSSVLFAKLQFTTASQIGLDPTWMVAANGIGTTAGKIISPQSIAIATAATDTVGQESVILRKVIRYYIGFIIIYGLVAYFGAMLNLPALFVG